MRPTVGIDALFWMTLDRVKTLSLPLLKLSVSTPPPPPPGTDPPWLKIPATGLKQSPPIVGWDVRMGMGSTLPALKGEC